MMSMDKKFELEVLASGSISEFIHLLIESFTDYFWYIIVKFFVKILNFKKFLNILA